MPGYIKNCSKNATIVSPQIDSKPQHCPYSPPPKQYGTKAQAPIPINISPKLLQEDIKEIQCVIGSILYYARAVEINVLIALSSIAIEQTKGTTSRIEKAKQLQDYLATNSNATIWFQALDMIMNIHSNALYLSEANACSRACGHFFHGVEQ
jgi:hypothetical protein